MMTFLVMISVAGASLLGPERSKAALEYGADFLSLLLDPPISRLKPLPQL